jgi:hypothetical protein
MRLFIILKKKSPNIPQAKFEAADAGSDEEDAELYWQMQKLQKAERRRGRR